ncbi:DYL1 protein, partial [Steatornis caripensis]|nr:DYL1 protein [Steatornis caripensis]
TSDRKAAIKNADTSGEMQQGCVGRGAQALGGYSIEEDIAAHVNKEGQRLQMPTQSLSHNGIVGRSFGSYVTHEAKHFIYVYPGQVAILLFKSG